MRVGDDGGDCIKRVAVLASALAIIAPAHSKRSTLAIAQNFKKESRDASRLFPDHCFVVMFFLDQ
jgi:hypothetical protein